MNGFVGLVNDAGSLVWPIISISSIIMTIGLWLIIFHKNLKIIRLYFYSSIFPLLIGVVGSILNSTLSTIKVAFLFSIFIILFGMPSYIIHKIRFKKKI